MTKGISCSNQVARSPDYTRPLMKLALIPWVFQTDLLGRTHPFDSWEAALPVSAVPHDTVDK